MYIHLYYIISELFSQRELNQNRLRRIEGLRFQGLESLLSLRLRRNGLTELMDGAFWGLRKIQNL